ncbi:major capsid protein [Bartonella sp. DGB2]|uniref:major capsid protein n=1 Tax=Bartonella sp. DGB2 TaxID=3388426 RepID=UPI00398FFD57
MKSNECQFIPQGADGVFQQTFAPAESFEFVNQQGLPLYAELIPDRDSNAWIKVRIASYPLFICTNPAMLLRGVNATSQRRANKTL